MIKRSSKFSFLILLILIMMFLTSCSYFYPINKKGNEIELLQQKNLKLNYLTLHKGDIFEGYTIGQDESSVCFFVNDPKKTYYAKADIEDALVEKIYVALGDYVKEGDILIQYQYDVDEDTEFILDLSMRRALLKYENSVEQFNKGFIKREEMDFFKNDYLKAKEKWDDFKALESKHTLRAPAQGYIANIQDYSTSYEVKQNVGFQISNKEDGFLLLFAAKSNENAAYPFYVFREGAKTRVTNKEETFDQDALVQMTNSTFLREYSEYPDSFFGENMIYMVLELENQEIKNDLNFQQTFVVSLINKEIRDVLLLPKDALETDSEGRSYVYKVTDDNNMDQQYVTIGEEDRNFYQIIEGLKEGDKVLIR